MKTIKKKNHAYNKILDRRNMKQGNIGQTIYANGQNRNSFKDYRFGFGTMGKNGCLAMAVYNCNIVLGMYEGLSGIIDKIHKYFGMNFGGILGGRPWMLWPYYKKRGCRVSFHFFPTVRKIEEYLNEKDSAGILLYFWWGKGIGGHYVTIARSGEKTGKYKVFNEYQNTACARVHQSVEELKKNSFFILFCSVKKGKQMRQLVTRWSKKTDEDRILPEYPRPMMERDQFTNLNGWWECTFCEDAKFRTDRNYEHKIRVPFAPESFLSGVSRQLMPGEFLWYKREFDIPEEYTPGRRLILHFGAVDRSCKVYINGIRAVCHEGGYLPFEADISDLVRAEGKNEITVCVKDPTEYGPAGRGKQSLKRGGMFYTAQSGIWQTVWLECVEKEYVTDIWCEPLKKTGCVRIHYKVSEPQGNSLQNVSLTVYKALLYNHDEKVPIFRTPCEYRTIRKCMPAKDGTETLVKNESEGILEIELPPEDIKLWSPETPYLYFFDLCYGKDEIESYFALRYITIEKNERGQPVIFLNQKKYFQKGVLDQGYWPDGIFTPPSDEAFIFDILQMKRHGFNMIRKHLKVEPQRWYYHCDRLGMLVWQDMVNGGGRYHFWFVTYLATLLNTLGISVRDVFKRLLSRENPEGRRLFEKEMTETVSCLKSHPCIVMWVLFNEGWGQFETVRLTKKLKELDQTRLIDSASGWFDQKCGDIRSQHFYFFKLRLGWEEKRATVLSEIGGFPYRIEGHSASQNVYGYHLCRNPEELKEKYTSLMETLEPEIKRGLSATVYTQLSDIEDEVNGIFTYDREICKFPFLLV